MKKIFTLLVAAMMILSVATPCFAANNNITTGEVTGHSVLAGAASLIVWPGIGQAMNDADGEKVKWHVISGLLIVPRVWSCYDAVVVRKGGYWKGRI